METEILVAKNVAAQSRFSVPELLIVGVKIGGHFFWLSVTSALKSLWPGNSLSITAHPVGRSVNTWGEKETHVHFPLRSFKEGSATNMTDSGYKKAFVNATYFFARSL